MPNASRCRLAIALACTCGALSVSSSAFAQTPAEADAPKKPVSVYTKDGLLGPVRVGPTVGIGAPDGMRFGLFTTYRGLLGLGGALSTVPTVGIGTVQASRLSGEGFFRIHPFRGAFFAGVAGGVARTEGASSQLAVASVATSRVDLHTQATVVYVAPHVGFRWMLSFGMTVGFDAGVEFPVASNGPTYDATHGTETEQVQGKGAIAKAMTFAANKPVPVLHLLEIGYAF